MKRLFFIAFISLLSCASDGGRVHHSPESSRAAYPGIIDEMVKYMSSGNFDGFVSLIPERGILISVDAYIDEIDPVITPTIARSDKLLLWGYEPGSGRPIKLTFRQFFDRYLNRPYDKGKKSMNDVKCAGNTPFNIDRAFDKGVSFVEFCIPGTKKNGYLDWQAVRFVYIGDSLLAVVHDSWSP